MPLPALVPLLGVAALIALVASNNAKASSPSSPALPLPSAILSKDEMARLAAWLNANVTPDQNAMLATMMRASLLSSGSVSAADLCSGLTSVLTPSQMASVTAAFPVLSQCFPPSGQDGAPPAPSDSIPPESLPNLPDAEPGMPAPPPMPDVPSAPGGGGAMPLPMPSPTPLPGSGDTGTPTSVAQKNAAISLQSYLASSGKYGAKGKPDATVKKYQTAMGKLTADGIVGPKTIARAKALGVVLPQKPGAAVQPATPKPSVPAADGQAKAAAELATYLRASNDFGSKAKPSPTVKQYQMLMGKLTADGIVGPKTIARAKALGVTLPAKTTAAVKPGAQAPMVPVIHDAVIKPTATTTASSQAIAAIALRDYLNRTGDYGSKAKPSAQVRSYQQAIGGGLVPDGIVGPKTRAEAAKYGAILPMPIVAAPAASQKDAAQKLSAYLQQTRDFGSKAKPSAQVKAYQQLMGGLTADGIVGPKTTDRANALGVALPQKTATPSTSAASQQTAAKQLATYLQQTHDFGSKAKPSAQVRAFQAAMGSVVADGIVGPKTTARARALGAVLPAQGAAPAAPVIPLTPAPARPASAPPGYNAAEANRLARVVTQEVQQNGAKYNHGLVRSFQQAAGLTADGLYGPRTVGALKYYGSTRAPASLSPAGAREVAYHPPV